jgi:hypothetical protein
VTINWEHVEATLDEIDKDHTKLSMYMWEMDRSDCSTIRCLAGWATEMARRSGLAQRKREGITSSVYYITTAADYLGLPPPDFTKSNYGGYTNLFAPEAYTTSRPSTDEFRTHLKEYHNEGL